jgi:hypothetical protein
VLLVDGRAAPAPLARLIAPGTFVMQSEDGSQLSRLAAFDGPGVAAIFEERGMAARFVHDPSGGGRLADRLEVTHLPDRPRSRVAGVSAERQAEELAWLRELQALAAAAAAPSPGSAAAGPQPATPADQLAAWLLRQTDTVAAE